jgi:hypothetical protein
MKTTDFPSISGLMSDFEADHKAKLEGKEKAIPKLERLGDELTCNVYVSGTLAVLATLGLKDTDILQINDRHVFGDFPSFFDAELNEDLNDMAGFEVTSDTFIWQVARSLCTGETPKAKRANYN